MFYPILLDLPWRVPLSRQMEGIVTASPFVNSNHDLCKCSRHSLPYHMTLLVRRSVHNHDAQPYILDHDQNSIPIC